MLLHMDFPSGSVGLYGTNAAKMLDGMYAENNAALVEDPDPNVTGNVMWYSADIFGVLLRKVLPASVTSLGFANRVYFPSLPSSIGASNFNYVISLRDGGNTDICSITVNTDGRIAAYRGTVNGGVLLGTSAAPAITAAAWHHVEVKFVLSATVGTVEVRVNGVTVLNLTGQNTGAGPCTQVAQGHRTFSDATGNFYSKDWILWDTTGAFNNNFMGSCSVKELIPDGDISANWALTGAANHYGAVNEAPPDDDTKYIYAVTPAPAADVMSLTNLPVDVTSVRGLMVINRSKNTDGGDGKLQAGLVSGASTQLYTDRQLTTAYTYWTDISETDPATAAAWLPGAVNAMNLRLNRTL